nr:MAG TPA: hypothetical protein [Bacteriophage sp.]
MIVCDCGFALSRVRLPSLPQQFINSFVFPAYGRTLL